MRTDNRSEATKAQQIHWELLGQLYRINKLTIYMLDTHKPSPRVRQSLVAIRTLSSEAIQEEHRNNEFINLKLPRRF
jgi:hypothetical protein